MEPSLRGGMRDMEDAALACSYAFLLASSRACGWLLPHVLRAAEQITPSDEVRVRSAARELSFTREARCFFLFSRSERPFSTSSATSLAFFFRSEPTFKDH